MFEFEAIPLHWVNRLSFLVRKELAAEFAHHGHHISPEEWAVMLILWRDHEQTPGVIADATFRDRTTITRLVDGLVKKGLVERDVAPDDRRKSILRTTTVGQELQKELVPIASGIIEQALDGIDQRDFDSTVGTLRKMTENLVLKRTNKEC